MARIRRHWYLKPGSRYPIRLYLCKGKFKSGVKYTRRAKPIPVNAQEEDDYGFKLPKWSKDELSFPIGGVLFVILNSCVFAYLYEQSQSAYTAEFLGQITSMSYWAFAAIIVNALLTILFGLLSGFGRDNYRLTAFLCYLGVSITPAIPFMPGAAFFAFACLGFSYFVYKKM